MEMAQCLVYQWNRRKLTLSATALKQKGAQLKWFCRFSLSFFATFQPSYGKRQVLHAGHLLALLGRRRVDCRKIICLKLCGDLQVRVNSESNIRILGPILGFWDQNFLISLDCLIATFVCGVSQSSWLWLSPVLFL